MSDEEFGACSICGCAITTGLMAAFCARERRCEFWPDGEDGERAIRMFREDFGIVPEMLGDEWTGALSHEEKVAQLALPTLSLPTVEAPR